MQHAMRIGIGIGDIAGAPADPAGFLAIPFRVQDDPDAIERTRALLAETATRTR